jgi:hypothetical protein
MPSFTSSFSLRFIRNTNSSASQDDTISVRKDLSTGEFQMTYKDENNGDPTTHVMNYLYRARVLDHLYLVLKNQNIDDDGFEAVQFNLPAMPRMLVNIQKFADVYYREHFLDLIGNALDCLDTLETRCPSHRSARASAKAAPPQTSEQAWADVDIARARREKAKADAEAYRAGLDAAEAAAHSAARVAASHARAQAQNPTPTPTSYFYDFHYNRPSNSWDEEQTPMDVETPTRSSVRRSQRLSSRASSSMRDEPFDT